MGPNIIQQESRMRSIPDAALRQMLIQMTQTGQVGTPEYLLAAGEIQSRKDARTKAAAGQGNPTPVIADLLTGGAMPPQMPMLPENAGGVAALPAPNMDNVAEMAAGGLVAFEGGGSTFVPRQRGAFMSMFGPSAGTISREEIIKRLSPEQLREFNRTGALPDTLKELVGENVIAPVAAAPVAVAAAPAVAAPAGIEALGQTQAATAAPAAPAAPTVREKPDGAPAAAAPSITAVSPFSVSGALDQGTDAAKKLMGGAPTVPAQTTLDDIRKAYTDEQQLFKDLGIADPTQMRREQLEKEITSAKTDKEQAGWMRLAEFGFNWASQNGPALQAAAKAGAAVMPGLMSDLKDLRKVERDQQKELAGLAALDAQSKRDMTAKARDRLTAERTRAEERLDNYQKQLATLGASIGGQLVQRDTSLQVANLQASTQRDVAGMQASALKEERDLARKDARAKVALESAEEAARDISDPTEKAREIKKYFREFYSAAYGEGAGAAPRAQGRVVNGVYVPAGK